MVALSQAAVAQVPELGRYQDFAEKAIEEMPVAAAWRWEVHTTSDPNQAASCFAGGKHSTRGGAGSDMKRLTLRVLRTSKCSMMPTVKSSNAPASRRPCRRSLAYVLV
jgi:hypothetical protein